MVTPLDLIPGSKVGNTLQESVISFSSKRLKKNQFNKIQKPSNTCVIKYKEPKMFRDEGNSHGVQETTLKNLSQTFHKCRNYNLAT